MLKAFLWTLTTLPALACSCASYEPVKACQILHSTAVVFRGRPIDHNHDGTEGFGQMTLYRFEVLERFKGLSPETKEVFIDPGSGTSCYGGGFDVNKEYLIYTGSPAHEAPVAMTVLRRPELTTKKKLPEAWKGKEQLRIYIVMTCNPSRAIKGADDPDLAYLRARTASGTPKDAGWIEGRAVQNLEYLTKVSELAPVPDAVLTLTPESGGGEPRKIPMLADGSYRGDALAPGKYTFSARSPKFGPASIRVPSLEIPPGGCAVSNLNFESNAKVSGTVYRVDGSPAAKTRVEFGSLLPDGRILYQSGQWTTSDADGAFTFSRVPAAPVVVGANIDGAPTKYEPYDPVFAPGTPSLPLARRIELSPGQHLQGVDLKLPAPLPFGELFVHVKWSNGSTVTEGARAFAETGGKRADFQTANDNPVGRVRLQLALGRTYEIRADWLTMNGKFLYLGNSEKRRVEFTKSGQTVEIRLSEPGPPTESKP